MVSQSAIGRIGQAPTSPGGSNHGSDGVAFYLLRGTLSGPLKTRTLVLKSAPLDNLGLP